MRDRKIFKAMTSAIIICSLALIGVPAALAAEKAAPPLTSIVLPQRIADMILKEHDKYISAFVNAEMGNRYFLKQIYDAKYRGKKAPTKEELKAMLFELKILNKELSTSAKRYARNISMAKMAMAGMDEEEKTLLARALSGIFATPAYAFDFSVLDKIKSGLQSVADAADAIVEAADSAVDAFVDKASEVMDAVVDKASAMADAVGKEVEQFKNRYFTMATVYRGGEITAAGVVLLATAATAAIGTVAAAGTLASALALGAPAVSTVAACGMLVAIPVAAFLGITQTAEAGLAFADVVADEDNSDTEFRKGLKIFNLTGSALSITNGVVTGISKAGEITFNIVDATKDYWMPKLGKLLDSSEDAKAPGREGVGKVKKAKASAGRSNVGDGGGG